jgi:fermentation-respiration switch protein FrsA (DUF1100 family)
MAATPTSVGLSFEDLYISTSDGIRINGWYVPFPDAKVTLLWFHGNAGNLTHRVDQLRDLHHELGVNVLMMDYREYGRSEGEVTEEGTYQDALAAYDYLVNRPGLDPLRIVVYGQSLGAAVAVDLAVNRRVHGLVLEAPFASIRAMAAFHYPWIPFGKFLSTRYDSLGKIGKVDIPLLILHGDQDEIVPYGQGKNLYEAANSPKQFYTISGAGHNDVYIVGGARYFRVVRDFIQGLGKKSGL